MKIIEYKIIRENNKLRLVEDRSFNFNKDFSSYDNIVEMLNKFFRMNVLNEEYVYIVSLDSALNCLGVFELSHGTTRHASVTNKELFTFLLLTGADGFIIAHNHPSGQLEASKDDYDITSDVNAFSAIMNIDMIESIIISNKGYTLIQNEKLKNFKKIFKNGG